MVADILLALEVQSSYQAWLVANVEHVATLHANAVYALTITPQVVSHLIISFACPFHSLESA